MKTYFFAFFVLLIFVSNIPSIPFAAESERQIPHISLLNKSTMEDLTRFGAPSEQHRILSSLIGNWDYDLKYWQKKDAEPQISSGSASNEMVMGGRFLSSKANASLNIGGQAIPYEAWHLLGYDTIKKSYTSILIDTMHTGITTSVGQYNEKLKRLEEKGTFTHPLLDKERTYRSELTLEGSDAYKQTIFIFDNVGKEYKVVELSFRRKM